jgi:hypothetical protein
VVVVASLVVIAHPTSPTVSLECNGSEAKPARSEKVEVELIFEFRDEKKPQMYPLRYIEDFFSSRNSKSSSRSALAAGRGFASLPKGKA